MAHIEHHFKASDTVRDIVIGMADGLTVPFALAAGITGAAVAIEVVVTAGIAEIAAGSIAMGLGGYLAARSALTISTIGTLAALFVFGYFKARFTGTDAMRSAIHTFTVGGFAAGAAFLIARLVA